MQKIIAQNKDNFPVCIDWLQLNCISNNKALPKKAHIYKTKKLDYQTRHFKSVYEVYLKNEIYASVAMNPHSSVLDEAMALVKIENKFLYNDNLINDVKYMLLCLGLEFKSITRVDIACDFNSFMYNKSPEKVINQFISGDIKKLGKTKFKVMGKSNMNLTYEYLKFGSETSIVSYYLYNKSKELEAVKSKPWIKEYWQKNNIDTSVDVWRLEFSIKSNLLELIELPTGEAHKINEINIIENSIIKILYAKMLEKNWLFVKPYGHSKPHLRNKIKYIDIAKSNSIMIRLSEKISSNRTDKIMIKKLVQYADEMRGTNFNLSIYRDDIIKEAVFKRDLVQWAMRNNIV